MPKQTNTPEVPAPHGFVRLVQAAKVGEGGLALAVTPSPNNLAKIAEYLELVSLQALTADVQLSRWRAKGVKVTGHFAADVTQSCVVTLEPVQAHIEGDFERHFLPGVEVNPSEGKIPEIHVDAESEDPPEPLGREIDVGEIIVEELSLALDPYPRKPGVEFAAEQETVVKPDSPFAVLAKLRGKGGRDKRKR
jgi:uncharacterized metal-binding protein YceD (DUF177 family)